ncbi:MAG: hypothetical protein U1E17_07010 [Geminicoccaceae bacterium]
MPATPPPLRPWSRVALIAVLFLPTPLIAAYPGLAGLFAQDWAGVPAVIWLVPAYLVLFMLLAVTCAGFSARMEG